MVSWSGLQAIRNSAVEEAALGHNTIGLVTIAGNSGDEVAGVGREQIRIFDGVMFMVFGAARPLDKRSSMSA
jgi:hypothetical protein